VDNIKHYEGLPVYQGVIKVKEVIDLKLRNGFYLDQEVKVKNPGIKVFPIKSRKKVTREYRVLEEVEDQVRFEETGTISKIRVINYSKYPVFIRAGEILKGRSQNRAIKRSIVVFPGEDEYENKGYLQLADVFCVHSTQAITGGTFTVSCLVPHYHESLLYSNVSQSDIWRANTSWNTGMPSSSWNEGWVQVQPYIPGTSDYSPNDLYSKVKYFYDDSYVEELMKKKRLKDCIGIVIFDWFGIKAIEIFDSEESWSAIRRKIFQKYSIDFQDNWRECKITKEFAEKILKNLLKNKFKTITKYFNKQGSKYSSTVYLGNLGMYEGEITKLNRRVIHFACVRGMKDYFKPIREPEISQEGPLILEY